MRHPLHALCPYFAMFPEEFVQNHLFAYSKPGDLVLDPFAGRGTTLFESILNNRRAIGIDINPVAACVSGAKVQAPSLHGVLDRVSSLELESKRHARNRRSPGSFFDACYHRDTLQDILLLRDKLRWRRSKIDRFIAAVVLGALHGESHRSKLYLSNRMPRTISTKPAYSIKWWSERGYVAPARRTFDVIRDIIRMRYKLPPPNIRGQMRLADARKCAQLYPQYSSQVSLVITSPPYIDVTDYSEDQWLRLWFLGGAPEPRARLNRDDRYTVDDDYWNFLTEVWAGCAPLLAKNSRIVIRIGGRTSADDLFEGVSDSLREGLSDCGLKVRERYRHSSVNRKRQTNVFRPGTSDDRNEHDFIFSVR
jgi:hypothetical protein